MEYNAGRADVAVIGAGHAGIEAALACARLGMNTLLFTINLDAIANLPCNPAIGGTGKGHLVYEIDALGGEMGIAADKVTLQSRILNMSKGPAVHSKRVQADRTRYKTIMKQTIENQPNLSLIQAEVVSVKCENNKITHIVTALGAAWEIKAAIICTGTFLNGKIIIGDIAIESGPDGMLPAHGLTESLKSYGIKFMRFKTGTPARVHRDSIDLDILEVQQGDDVIVPYSSVTDEVTLNSINQIPCHIVYTNQNTHDIIKANLHRSPLYSGKIEGVGARYCPSIEDKVVRFADKERHQLFIEPMGSDTKEMYIQGFSSSLPEEIQVQMLHSLKGFENARIMRTAYAIEYDCIDPTQLFATMEFKYIENLYSAGQFNGTSGYEEAAAQGLIAGINAALKIQNKPPLILTRDSSYIGTLIDDIVTKGTNEPYRIMTSRSEYRLLLRQDNADARLSKYGYDVGLLSGERYHKYLQKQELITNEIKRVSDINLSPTNELNELLRKYDTAEVTTGISLSELLKRPQLDYEKLQPIDCTRPELPYNIIQSVQIEIKYEGYIKRQIHEAAKFQRLEDKKLPDEIDYLSISGIRIEARQKLQQFKPASIGQASRISGISPADITVLMIYLSQYNQRGEK